MSSLKNGNVIFLGDTPFDTDIDDQFKEAEALFYGSFGNEGVKFLKRPQQEEQMYEDMHRMADAGGDDESDEDTIINSLEQNMVQQGADPKPSQAEEDTKAEEDQVLDDLLDDLLKE